MSAALPDTSALTTAPLVSVLVRSMGRASLAQALDSVAAQTYPRIELVVVAARADHAPLPERIGPIALRAVTPGHALARSAAANAALDAAQGEYLLFLDDDDWLMPDHIARLVQVLQAQTTTLAAYTGVALVDADGQPSGQAFDLPFDPVRQLAGNLTPIHAVLFSARLRALGCRFDESLDRYEDWDFWLQLARHTLFAHLPGVSAVYRIHDSSGVHDDVGAQGASSLRIYQKWQDAWSPQQLGQIMQRVWSHAELQGRLAANEQQHAAEQAAHAQTQRQLSDASRRLDDQAVTLQGLEHSLAQLSDDHARQHALIEQQARALAELERALAEQRHETERWRLDHQAVVNSRSWKLTRPLRWLASTIRARTQGKQ
ncbi:MAG: glycosyltransferase [Burkholderiales bacterium]|nr:glycosyltransferase [Burkholderiales bacterium]